MRARELELLMRWPSGTQQHRIATREGETFVVECGPQHGSPVLLLHGTAANSAMWSADVPIWSKQLRVFAVDIIGDAGLSAPSRPRMDSDAHALWLDDILDALHLDKTSLVGVSFGGWLALDYATRRPHRVEKLVVLNPAGLGRTKNVLWWALPLLMLGDWGRRKMMERIGGKPGDDPSPERDAAAQFTALIFRHFRPRTASPPRFGDGMLATLKAPVMAVLGGKDVFTDAAGARRRLEAHASELTMRFLPEAHHFVPGQGPTIETFLTGGRAIL